MKPVYVIGHKNPDIDSLASSIAYKVFKQSTEAGMFVAAAASEPDDGLKSLLADLEFETPTVLNNVGTTVEDLLDEAKPVFVGTDTTLMELGNIMRRNNIKTVPVLDDNQRLLGLITIGDVAKIYMEALGTGKDIENSPQILRRILDEKVSNIMNTCGLVLFEKDEKWEEARKHMLDTRFRNYPVVDEENRYLGTISRYNLLNMKRKKVILVDHNEKKQAVDGIEEAEILEIIDHHRVGDLQTVSPIYFHNEPVGSTSTLIAEKFLYNKVHMQSRLAALLLSGIMSDTMIFKSPTTTGKDKQIAGQIAEICGLDPVEWGKKLFSQTNRVDRLTDEEIIAHDHKEFVNGNSTFAIAQIDTVDFGWISARRTGLLEAMENLCAQKNYSLMCLMITNVFEEGSEMLVAGKNSQQVAEAFHYDNRNGGIFLKGVLSRKKQVVPVIYEVLRRQGTL